ncbi:MAG TPA: histidinol-phosphate transaminase [Thermomicrobiales bacterium]|nr:histidinol-phosphate transaminase [Thermomicrobiales bacterium]
MPVPFDADRLVRQKIKELTPYHPVEAPEHLAERLGMPLDNIVKLDQNENPYGCSLLVQESLAAFDRYHLYPDADARRVRQRLGIYCDTNPDRIIVGAGSDELIDILLQTLLDPDDEAIVPSPTFGWYRARTELFGGIVREVPRDDNFDLPIEQVLDSIHERTKLVFVTSPNNPTGNMANTQDIVRLLETGIIVVVDEAYFEFSGKTVLPLTREFDNLVVLRTFSKWAGIAGLRFGYGIFPDVLVENILKVKSPFTITSAAFQAVEASLDDLEFLHVTINRIRTERRRLHRKLKGLDYMQPRPSVANFILTEITRGDAHDVHQRLADRGIMVRKYGDARLRDYLRISVGKPEDTDRLMSALQTIGARV